MKPIEPVNVVELFPEERDALLRLLTALSQTQWSLPTTCPGWTVHNIVVHLLGIDIGNLSRRRDHFTAPDSRGPASDSWSDLVAFVNHHNQSWVETGRRISPRLLCELLAVTGPALVAYYRGLDLGAPGAPVSWAGPAPAPVWLDIAREYTECWVHQQQIREAVQQPGLTEPRYLAPVLATFVHALPYTLRAIEAAPGSSVRLVITGPAGGRWIARRSEESWTLGQDDGQAALATLELDQDTAWRAWTKGLSREALSARARVEGNPAVARTVLEMVAIIA